MRRIVLQIIFFFVLVSSAISAQASPAQSIIGNGSGYTVADNHWGTDAAASAYFGWTGDQYSGFYIGTVEGNDKEDVLEAVVRHYFNNSAYEINLLGKVDNSTGGTSGALTYTIDPATESDGPEWIGGEWSLLTPYVMEFYSVKTTRNFALYYLDPAQASGTWWTGHLGADGVDSISHFSAVYMEGSPSETPVPEPATMILMGIGLLGLGFGLRKKNQ